MAPKTPDAQAGTIERKRRNDGIDARTIGEAGIHNGLSLIDATAYLGDDLLDDMEQVGIIAEPYRDFGKLAAALDVNFIEAVD